MEYIILSIIGLIAGVMSGMFGIGGGVVIVPFLVTFGGMGIKSANGTSLAALLLPVGILAVIAYKKENLINLKAGLLIALGLATGVAFGSMLALDLPVEILKRLYGGFLIFVSYRFLVLPYRRKKREMTELITAEEKEGKFWQFLLLGLVAGVMSGLFGIGGGVVIVPLLCTIFHFEQRKAAGTSLAALLLPVGLPGVIIYNQAGELSFLSALPVALGLLVGALGGARLAIGLKPALVKRLYGVFLLVIGIIFIFQG
ncbi:MAG: sulfite exporter TauE/SafE family protein [Candidatus Cloacimonetes bacterium]|nr:sulfite exporter TauE/SafE family protein [Candidatus Cloacimonadota bacterium]